MENLDQWDCAETFNAIEAAYLIRGFDPSNDPTLDEKKVRPIVDRMRKDFDTTCWNVLSAAYDGDESETLRKYSDKGLLSIVLDELISDIATNDNNMDLFEFYAAKRAQEAEQEKYPEESKYIDIDFEMEKNFPFHEQQFSRENLQKWITRSNLKSAYKFSQNILTSDQYPEKPIETRERNTLLTIIAVLCKEAGHDYEKRSKTAEVIMNASEKLGLPLARRTIEEHLRKIPSALESRSK